jgi:hypothetical protein
MVSAVAAAVTATRVFLIFELLRGIYIPQARPAPAQANPSEEQKLSNELYYASCRLQLEIVRRNPEIEVARKFEPDLQAFLSKAGGSRSGEPCRGTPRRRRPACGTARSA